MIIAFLIYPGMTALDLVGPHEVLARLPDAEIVRASSAGKSVVTDTGLILHADTSIADVDIADLLVVPGATSIEGALVPGVLPWIRLIDSKTAWTTSVCTGSLVLGAAGLLRGQQATTHWAVHDDLKTYSAEPVRSRVVESGKFLTAAGVSAGIDLALTLAERISGALSAKSIQLTIEYDPKLPFDSGDQRRVGQDVIAASLSSMKKLLKSQRELQGLEQ